MFGISNSFCCWTKQQNELDWGAAGVLRSAIPQNRIHHIHALSFAIAFQYSMYKTLCLSVLFILRWVSKVKNTE